MTNRWFEMFEFCHILVRMRLVHILAHSDH
jgi:hypothetical protein